MNKQSLLLLGLSIVLLGCGVKSEQMSSVYDSPADVSSTHVAPSYDCSNSSLNSIEPLICRDDELAKQDYHMSTVYRQAITKAQNEHPPILKVEQQGWIKGRNDCWKNADKKQCITESYTSRITELQAKYRLVAHSQAIFYRCDNNPTKEVVVTYFETTPASLIAEHGDQTSFMTIQPSGSGAKYQGQNEQLWEHHGEATIIWGYQAPEMNCKVVK